MSAAPDRLLSALSADGQRADDVARAICLLVKDGAELGELEHRDIIGADGVLVRSVKLIPKIWLDRLARAIEVGAFERLTVKAIVERILAPPPPEHLES